MEECGSGIFWISQGTAMAARCVCSACSRVKWSEKGAEEPVLCLREMKKACTCSRLLRGAMALVGRRGRCGRGEGDGSLLSGRENDDGSIATSNGFPS